MTAVVKSANAINALLASGDDVRFNANHEQQRRADHDQNADAGERAVGGTDQPGHVTADGRDEEAHQHDVDDAADDERRQMRAEAARVAKITEHPADRQHANQRDKTDDADRNVALGDRQRVGFAGFARARGSHRAGEATRNRLHQLQQRPDRRNADRARADETHFVLQVFCASAAAAVVRSPAMAEKCGTPHPQPMNAPISIAIPTERPTKMTDRQKRERQREIITADRAASADAKSLRDVCSEDLRPDDHREHGGNDRSPQNCEQTGAAVFDIDSLLRIFRCCPP